MLLDTHYKWIQLKVHTHKRYLTSTGPVGSWNMRGTLNVNTGVARKITFVIIVLVLGKLIQEGCWIFLLLFGWHCASNSPCYPLLVNTDVNFFLSVELNTCLQSTEYISLSVMSDTFLIKRQSFEGYRWRYLHKVLGKQTTLSRLHSDLYPMDSVIYTLWTTQSGWSEILLTQLRATVSAREVN